MPSPGAHPDEQEPAQRITHRQAAQLLSCHISNITKLLAKGQLHSVGFRSAGVGTLDLDEVLALREARLQAEREKRLRYDRVDPPRKGPPAHLGDHDWLSVEQVALRLDRTESAVRDRARRGTIPHVRDGKRTWIRADHLEVWQRARQVTGPEDPAAR